jgi:hypothetical protein
MNWPALSNTFLMDRNSLLLFQFHFKLKYNTNLIYFYLGFFSVFIYLVGVYKNN